MNYADRLAEFVKVTGHRPGEMNKPTIADAINQLAQQLGLGECDATHDGGIVNGVPFGILASKSRLTAADHAKLISFDDSSFPSLDELLSIEPPAQSAGPGRCNRFTRAVALGDPKPCVLVDGHEGPHEL